MDANLVGARGEGATFQKRKAPEAFPNREFGARTFSAALVNTHDSKFDRVRRNLRIHFKSVLLHGTANERDVGFQRFLSADHSWTFVQVKSLECLARRIERRTDRVTAPKV